MATTKHILSRVQRQRAEALRRAREVLSSSGLMSQGAVDALDVIRVADYILSGVEYLDRPPAPPVDYTERNKKAIDEELTLATSGTAWIKRGDYEPWEPIGNITDPGFTLADQFVPQQAPPAEPPYSFSPKLDNALNRLFEERPLYPTARELADEYDRLREVPPAWDGLPAPDTER